MRGPWQETLTTNATGNAPFADHMKRHHQFWHYLFRLLLASLFLAQASGCNRMSSESQSADRDASLVGKYTFTEREVASEIELGADGTFTYILIYGAHDEGAIGTWHSTDQHVILEVENTKQADLTPPPTDTLEMRRDGQSLILTRQSNELVYVKQPDSTITGVDGKRAGPDRRIPLDIVGYNYTNRYIDSFKVDGYGGGNISLSTPTSGGGSPFCCYYFMPGVGFPYEIEVEWAPSASDGPWKKTKALIPEPKTDRPKYLEIHFYPDGHIESELTGEYSPPRLKLTKKNENER
jgi:hypothetical protein